MSNRRRWGEAGSELSPEVLRSLMAGEIPAIHLADFATTAECGRFCAALRETEVEVRAASTSPMAIVGGNLSNFRGESKTAYFAGVEPAYRDTDKLFEASFDPLQRMIDRLAAAWPARVRVAAEPEPHGRYFAGGVKSRVEGSALHFDYVPYLLGGYAICDITDQFSWNLYLEVPSDTGHTTVYDAMVRTRPADRFGVQWNNKLPSESVAGAASYTFMPRVGEAVLFNTRCPHTITVESIAAGERRTQIGSFIGRMPDDELVLWS